MDYEALRAGIAEAVPYNKHLGLELLEVADGRAVVRLPEGDHLHNHVGTQHAGALFSAAEAASGAAFVGGFAERLGEITPLVRGAEVRYTAPARGPIDATAMLAEDAAALLERLDADGRVEFPVQVELVDGDGKKVAEMSVTWNLRKNA